MIVIALNRAPGMSPAAAGMPPAADRISPRGGAPGRLGASEFVTEGDIVLIGSGVKTRDVVADDRPISRLLLDPSRHLIGAQCSGALVLARLGLLKGMPACTDIKSRPLVEACGVTVLDAPFHAEGNIATAGGCLASQYLATWVISRVLGEDTARDVIGYVAPVGENQETVEHAIRAVHSGETALR